MSTWDQLLKLLGGLAVGASGLGAIGLIAYQIFKWSGQKWLESRFAERLQALKYVQDKELEEFRFRIHALLDRATKLHSREFEVLPEAWSKLNDAFGQGNQFVSPFQSYPDLEREGVAAREAFLAKCRLYDWERAEVQKSSDMNKKYQELIFKHDLAAAKNKSRDAGSFLMRNGIFVEKEIRARFQEIIDLIWSAIVETEVNQEVEHGYRHRDAVQSLRSSGEPKMRELEAAIYERLWPPNSTAEPGTNGTPRVEKL